MKKVVCLVCGLVNLDRFTTYPNCAACGVRLPEKPTPKWRTFWFQPVRPFYWATVVGIGVAVLGVGAGGLVRDTRDTTPKLLVVYLQVPRSTAANGLLSVRFILDSTEGNPAQSFDMVRLRFSRELEQNFQLVALSPTPETSENSAVGQYFMWRTLPRVGDLQLTLKPRRSGKLQLKATLAAKGYAPFDVQRTVFAPPPRAQKEK
jgi:hypothetical protein